MTISDESGTWATRPVEERPGATRPSDDPSLELLGAANPSSEKDPSGVSRGGGIEGDHQKVDDTGRPCYAWILWEEYCTQEDERVCPVCGPLDGQWFQEGHGPVPPLHDHCRCYRVTVWAECLRNGDATAGGNYQ